MLNRESHSIALALLVAVLFLYGDVLRIQIGPIQNVGRARVPNAVVVARHVHDRDDGIGVNIRAQGHAVGVDSRTLAVWTRRA